MNAATKTLVGTLNDKDPLIAPVQIGNSTTDTTIWHLAMSPDGSTVYVLYSTKIALISTATNAKTGEIDLLNGLANKPDICTASCAQALIVSPDGGRIYVLTAFGRLLAIDTATKSVTGVSDRLNDGGDYALEVSPDGSKIYVGMQSGVAVLSAANIAIVSKIQLTNVGRFIMSPDGAIMYAMRTAPPLSNPTTTEVDAISTVTNAAIATITIPIQAVGSEKPELAISPDGRTIYVSTGTGVAVINAASDALVTTTMVPSGARAVGITPDGSEVYVTSSSPNNQAGSTENSVAVISTVSNSVTGAVGVSAPPIEVLLVSIPGG